MPLKKCSNKGVSGWKWGNQGHCYTGPGAKKKAIKQGVVIEGPQKFAQMATAEEIEELLSDDDMTILDKIVLSSYSKEK